MADRLDLAWRTAATGFCFATFGLGGLLLRAVVFPLLNLVVAQRERRTRWARAWIHQSFRLFVGLMRGLGVMTCEVRGAERLQREGLLILANHPTLVDVVFLMSFVRRADCIVKAALAANPFTRGPVLAAGFVCNDSGAGMVEDCVRSLRDGNNLIIFPEGTRTPRLGHQPLQRGAANIAVRGRRDVTPVRIRVQPLTLGKGEKWYRVPPRRWHIEFDVGEDIPVAPFLADGAGEAIAARRLTEHLTDYFSRETPRAGIH
ncbi:MAG: lysophospholipid acyltransferase family protein [Burkholderiaceae bacterium]